MEYVNLIGQESGKCIICGCGKSLNELLPYIDRLPDLIGVNDSCTLFKLKYQIVVNDKSTFPIERWRNIQATDCPTVFTHLGNLGINNPAAQCIIPLGSYGGCDLGKVSVDFTANSTYIALMIAFKLGYRNIGIIGMDFTDGHFFGETGRHSLSQNINQINSEFVSLYHAIKHYNGIVVNLSLSSLITAFPKQSIQEFLQ